MNTALRNRGSQRIDKSSSAGGARATLAADLNPLARALGADLLHLNTDGAVLSVPLPRHDTEEALKLHPHPRAKGRTLCDGLAGGYKIEGFFQKSVVVSPMYYFLQAETEEGEDIVRRAGKREADRGDIEEALASLTRLIPATCRIEADGSTQLFA